VPTATPSPTPVNEVSDSRGAIRVRAFVCAASSYPADFDWDAECQDPATGATIELYARNQTGLVAKGRGTTDASGGLGFPLLVPGVYQVRQTNTTWCHAESDSVATSGDVIVRAGVRATVYIYNCPSK
jgi:hypothetical protein